MKITGGCRCGEVKYQIDGEPRFQVHCQCEECQRLTGSGHASIMIFPRDVASIQGNPKSYAYQAESGATVTHRFCGACGAPLYNENTKYPSALYFLVGSMDERSHFVPQRIVYSASAQSWDYMDPALTESSSMPTKK